MKPSFNGGVWKMDLQLLDSQPEEKKLLCVARIARQQQGENGHVVVSETSKLWKVCQIKRQETVILRNGVNLKLGRTWRIGLRGTHTQNCWSGPEAMADLWRGEDLRVDFFFFLSDAACLRPAGKIVILFPHTDTHSFQLHWKITEGSRGKRYWCG